jgi:hypothetical protein
LASVLKDIIIEIFSLNMMFPCENVAEIQQKDVKQLLFYLEEKILQVNLRMQKVACLINNYN